MEYSDDFWLSSSQRAFDFDADAQGDSADSKLSQRNTESNEFNPLRFSGLDEVAKRSSSADFPPIRSSFAEPVKYPIFGENNPLLIFPKKGSKFKGSGPEKTLRNMIMGLEYSLREYKSKEDKYELLRAALNTHDANAILEVVLFLRNTLKKSIFQKDIIKSKAFNIYVAYLEEDHKYEELTNILQLSYRPEDAFFLRYKAVVKIQDPERKLHQIERCLSIHFPQFHTDPMNQLSIEEHHRILKQHVEFLKNKSECSADEFEMMKHFKNLTRKKSVIDSSVITSLIYCCLFYYKSEKNSYSLACPSTVVSNYKLTKKQFTWAALRALASIKKWSDIEDLFMSKNWLGSTRLRSCIHFPRVLEVLSKAKAPIEVLAMYVACVENEQEKMDLAQKYACHSVAIEVFKNNKDRLGLLKYKSSLAPDSADFRSIIDALNNPQIRWKN